MAGGDLLYIFAFIILPTAVLVSCIWALIMLRNGRLLPQRPAPPADEGDDSPDVEIDHERDVQERDLIEETGEHVIVDPAQPLEPAAVVPAAPSPAIEVGPDPIPAPIVADASEVPVVEQTQELSPVPVEDVAEDTPEDVTDVPDAPSPVAADADVLIVPLEEPTPRYTNGRTESPAESAADQVPEEVEPGTVDQPEQQRPLRRPVRLHPAEPDPARSRPRIGQRKATRRDSR
jgi:hypothetical protein